MKDKKVPILVITCLFFAVAFAGVLFISFTDKSVFSTIETKQLIIRSDDGSAFIQLRLVDQKPLVILSDEKGKPRLFLEGGAFPSITLKDEGAKTLAQIQATQTQGAQVILHGDQSGVVLKDDEDKVLASFSKAKDSAEVLKINDNTQTKRLVIEGGLFPSLKIFNPHGAAVGSFAGADDSAEISLCDSVQNDRVHLKGGDTPGIFLKNENQQTIGSWTVLKDGGGGFGLAHSNGIASAILRGGFNPGVAFFANKPEPMASLGLTRTIPHLLISGQEENEGVLIHGGKPSGMMVMDEAGKLRIFISKHGYYKGKEMAEPQQQKDQKIFSLEEDCRILFPDGKRVE